MLFMPRSPEGARASVRSKELDQAVTAKSLHVEPGEMLFVQTEATPPVGTVVTLTASGAHETEQAPSFEGMVSFVCSASDQFGFSCGLGIRVTKQS